MQQRHGLTPISGGGDKQETGGGRKRPQNVKTEPDRDLARWYGVEDSRPQVEIHDSHHTVLSKTKNSFNSPSLSFIIDGPAFLHMPCTLRTSL
ncbi:hypothetical protein QL285_057806 [Trifolium repens]|nr:hypothetical protein QL285_057806 [Trifolium repens]